MTPEQLTYAIDVLSDVPGLQGQPRYILQDLAGKAEVRKLKEGAWLCREGDQGEALFILAEGEVRVIKASRSGRDFEVARLTPGVLFGHVAVVTEGQRTAGIRAGKGAVILQLSATTVKDLVEHGDMPVASPFRRALIVALARQLQSATATAMQVAVDAGITENTPLPEITADTTASLPVELPEDTEERLERARGLV